MAAIFKLDRREFLRLSGYTGAGLILGCQTAPQLVAPEPPVWPIPPKPITPYSLGAFLQIDTAGQVTIWVSKSEMGQGVRTALPMLVAEELDVPWEQVTIQQADLDPKYGRQGTGGSSSVRSMWQPLRTAGAATRAMLIAAAAQRWNIDAAELITEPGFVVRKSTGEKIAYADLVEAASALPVPEKPSLKDPKDFRVIGKRIARVDNPDIHVGKATYGIDVRLPGMMYAAVARPPVFGGKVVRFDATKAKEVPGVRDVVSIAPQDPPDHLWGGVAVIATDTYSAFAGKDALQIEWDHGATAAESTESLRKQMEELSRKPGKQVRSDGDVDSALKRAAKRIEAVYEFPYLAHATMEPMNCTALVTKDGLELWAPTQFPDWAAGASAKAIGVDPKKAKVHVTLLGGGFGRRANPDFAIEAALVSKHAGAPVKLTWTREDDMTHDYYRPASLQRLSAGLGKDGKPVAWRHRIVSPSINVWMNPKAEKPEDSEVGGADDVPYMIPNLRLEYAHAPSGVPRGWWRSVESSFNAFSVESFVDEIAAASRRDPLELRLDLLREPRILDPQSPFPFDTGRLRHVLEMAADKAGWGKPLPAGMGRGLAVHRSFYSYVAEVAEVSVEEDGRVKVHRVVACVDCGIPVNPDGVEAQIQSGIAYGLTATLKSAITIKNGRVEQDNFDGYPLLTLAEMPRVEVYIVPSTAPPTGMGEPGLPPIAPAVANALYALTRKRVRRLPIQLG